MEILFMDCKITKNFDHFDSFKHSWYLLVSFKGEFVYFLLN
jgi:hypothetical protein